MYCPDYNVIRNKWLCLTMYSDRDVPRKYVPKTQWINPLRYELILLPKAFNQNARMVVINEHGRAIITVSNLIYRAKKRVKAALHQPPEQEQSDE